MEKAPQGALSDRMFSFYPTDFHYIPSLSASFNFMIYNMRANYMTHIIHLGEGMQRSGRTERARFSARQCIIYSAKGTCRRWPKIKMEIKGKPNAERCTYIERERE
jgi:hypothetical protein